MKKLIALLMVLVLICGTVSAVAEPIKYVALARTGFYLRDFPGSGADLIQKVNNRTYVKVYEWGEEWCKVKYEGVVGYARTEWLCHMWSMDIMKYPLPDMIYNMTGIITFDEELFVSGGEFLGTTVTPGQVATVDAEMEPGSYVLHVWRDQMVLSEDIVTYKPFVDWQTAEPGDLIGGFTSFFGEQQGEDYPENRVYNIAHGCERLCGVVKAGAKFSFNDTCGPYDKANGYKISANIGGDGVGYGGGICQLATTTFNALLTLPLQITDWSLHTIDGAEYVIQFYDAMVGLYTNVQFINTLPYDIRLEAFPQDGALTVLIYRAE